MNKAIVEVIARYAAGTLAMAIGAAWTSPIWTRPDVQALGVQGAEAIVIIGATAGGVLVIGYTWHKLDGWVKARPPALSKLELPAQFANDADAQALAWEEEREEDTPDRADSWAAAATKFALLGNLEGFGWRSMCRFCGREDWRTLTELMIGGEVLTPPRGNRAPDWANGWSYTKFRVSLKYGRLSLPFPTRNDPPVVSW